MFVWIKGTLDKVVNTVAGRLDSDLKRRMGIPIKRGEFKMWKKALVKRDDEAIKGVAKHLMREDETIRLFYFLKKMQSASEQQPMKLKRKINDHNKEFKRLKSVDSCGNDEELMKYPIEIEQRTGIPLEMNGFCLDEKA